MSIKVKTKNTLETILWLLMISFLIILAYKEFVRVNTEDITLDKVEFKISDSIYVDENVDFILSDISKEKITIIADYSEGEDIIFKYPKYAQTEIKLRNTDKYYIVKKANNSTGVLELYIPNDSTK